MKYVVFTPKCQLSHKNMTGDGLHWTLTKGHGGHIEHKNLWTCPPMAQAGIPASGGQCSKETAVSFGQSPTHLFSSLAIWITLQHKASLQKEHKVTTSKDINIRVIALVGIIPSQKCLSLYQFNYISGIVLNNLWSCCVYRMFSHFFIFFSACVLTFGVLISTT